MRKLLRKSIAVTLLCGLSFLAWPQSEQVIAESQTKQTNMAPVPSNAGASNTPANAAISAALEAKLTSSQLAAPWLVLPQTASQGDVVLVRSTKQESVTWLKKTYRLQKYGKGYYAYLPVPTDMKAGKYKIGAALLTVKKKKFDVQYLKVTKEQEAMRRDTKKIEADQAKVNKARSNPSPTFLFKESFLQPIQGRLSTPYGFTRYINGKLSSSHKAIDLAAKSGTKVKAANDGKVVLAEMLYLPGNTVYIDHGMGLYTQYAHLSKINVKPGDTVKKGDVIGLVGSTGFSTGPHLHFAFFVGNTPVNPNVFFDTTPFLWNTKK